jgi:hypothetical protein
VTPVLLTKAGRPRQGGPRCELCGRQGEQALEGPLSGPYQRRRTSVTEIPLRFYSFRDTAGSSLASDENQTQ